MTARLLYAAVTPLVFAATAAAGRAAPVVFNGAPPHLADTLRLVSTVATAERRIVGAAALRRAAITDARAIAEALRAAGYYRAEATSSVDDGAVVFDLAPGPLFKVVGVEIVYDDAGDAARPATLEAAGVTGPLAPDGARLQQLQQRFVTRLWEIGYPDARIMSRHVDADFDTNEARAAFVFSSGARAAFGPIAIEGANKVSEEYVTALRPFESGEPYQRSKVLKFRDRLAETGLFNAIDVAPGPVEGGRTPVVVKLEERKARTIGAGVSYSTVEGPGGRIFLEHRNAFGRGERAFLELEGSKIRQSIGLEVSRPLPRETGSAFATLRFSNEPTAAFTARSLETSAGALVKTADERLQLHGAVALETTGLRSDTEDKRTYLVSFPVAAVWDSEDDLLNPTRGVRASLSATPTTGTSSFIRVEGDVRTRILFGPRTRYTAAMRARIGATLATTFGDLPSNERLYSGGGASVRGYGFQAVGALDANGVPSGGLSTIESAFEMRARVAKRVQIAAFVDAGSVSPRQWPDFSSRFFAGAGVGVRYFSPAGPIRLDLATPINGRDVDRPLQVYISLGQPF